MSFDPYRKWLGIPDNRRPPSYYELLGITAGESDEDVIRSAIDQRRGVTGVPPVCFASKSNWSKQKAANLP